MLGFEAYTKDTKLNFVNKFQRNHKKCDFSVKAVLKSH